MKDRLKNWLTTIVGAILILTAVTLFIIAKFKPEMSLTTLELTSITVLGWVFLTARDTLLEGVFLNFFKNKK